MGEIINSCPGALTGTSHSIFYQFINTMMATQCAISQEGLYPENIGPLLKDGDTFDFIVVGAGSAGSVVANRLAENKHWKILLLEAGEIPTSDTTVPALHSSLQRTKQDWQYVTEPQENACLGMKEHRCNWPQGKLVGGTGAINRMIYVRGNPRDYDQWAAAGNEGWDYESLLPYFKKSENLEVPELENDDTYGKGGYLTLTKHIYKGSLRQHTLDTFKRNGHNFSESEVTLGVFDALTTIKNGERDSTGKAYLTSVNYPNLYLATNAHVTKIYFDEHPIEATGVQVKIGKRYVNLHTSKELILSAGSINTPQLLMTSGIGPKGHLEDLGIKTVTNLPVGENLQDHVSFMGYLINVDQSMVYATRIEDEVYAYLTVRKGGFANIGNENFAAFVNTKNESQFADIGYEYTLYHQNDIESVERLMDNDGFIDEIKHSKIAYNKKFPTLDVISTLLYPKSRGKVLLASTNPLEKPLIFPNYLSDANDEDLETLLRGFKFALPITFSPEFSDDTNLLQLDIPNCNNIPFKTEGYWKCAIRNLATSGMHATSTCKMGVKEDPTSVVDSRLKVHGVGCLRIIDASVMPNIIGSSPNAAVIMIGEKGADMIKHDWFNK